MARVEDMWSPVAETAATIRIPTAPIAWVQLVTVGSYLRNRIDPLFPIQAIGEWFVGIGCGRRAPTMPTALAVHVRGDAGDVFDYARFTPCFKLEVVRTGMALVAHLRGDPAARREVDHALALAKGMGERFFAVDVLAQCHGEHGDGKVRMVWRGDDDRVDFVAHLVEHLAKVSEGARLVVRVNLWELTMLVGDRRQDAKRAERFLAVFAFQVDVAQSDHVTQPALHRRRPIDHTAVADADQREIDLFTRSQTAIGLVA